MTAENGFDCLTCMQHHLHLPLSIGFDVPDFYNQIPLWHRETRAKKTEDWCIIDDKHYYIRGCLEIPVRGRHESFVFGVWSTLNEEDFYRVMDLWQSPGRDELPALRGGLGNSLPLYIETRGLITKVKLREVGQRPTIALEHAEHLAYREQHVGMDEEKLMQLAAMIVHKEETTSLGIC